MAGAQASYSVSTERKQPGAAMKVRDVRQIRVKLLFWMLWNLVRMMPYHIASDFMALFARLAASWITRQDVIRTNLAIAFPEKSPQWIDQTALTIAGNFGRFAAEICHLDHLRDNAIFTASGHEQLRLNSDKPLIFVGPHVCNWELVPIFLSRNGLKLTIIYLAFGSPYLDRKLLAMRRLTGAEYVQKESAVGSVMRAMKAKSSVALLVDQKVSSGLEVEFFGRPSIITNLPARMALRFKAPIVSVAIERRTKHHFHIHFGEAIRPPVTRSSQAERMVTQEMAAHIETIIKRTPESWFCNKRRWQA
jgi:KDO2-lipid IV(A) lauroyltransferase